MELKDLTLQERALITWIRGATFKARLEVNLKGGTIGIAKVHFGTIATFVVPVETPLSNDEMNIISVLRSWKFGTLVIEAENGSGKINSDLSYMTVDFREIGTAGQY